MIDRLEKWICAIDPAARRRAAVHLVLWTFVLGVLNMVAWAFGVVTTEQMVAITAALSWLALTITAADIVIGTDIRAEVEG